MKKIFTILGVSAAMFANAQTTFDYVLNNQGFSNAQAVTTGNVIAGKITYDAQKNGATNAPSFYTAGGGTLRLYSSNANGNGNSYEVKAATGVKFNTIKFVTSGTVGADNYAPTSAIITVDGAVVPTVYDPADTTNATYLVTITNPASSVVIKNGNQGATSAQIRIKSVSIAYTDELAVGNVNASKVNLVKNTIVANELIFGQAANVSVINMAGQVVKTADVKENTRLDVSNLAKGTYVVTATVNGQAVSQKVIKK